MPIVPESETDALGYMLVPFSSSFLATIISRQTGTRVSMRSVEGWKSGRCLPRVELLEALASALDIPVREVRDAYTRSKVARRSMARTQQTRRRNRVSSNPKKSKHPKQLLQQVS